MSLETDTCLGQNLGRITRTTLQEEHFHWISASYYKLSGSAKQNKGEKLGPVYYNTTVVLAH